MPSASFGGEKLTGSLTYSVKLNGTEVSSGTAEAGSEVHADINAEKEGVAKITVTATNEKGESPKAHTAVFVGFDTPAKTDVTDPAATCLYRL